MHVLRASRIWRPVSVTSAMPATTASGEISALTSLAAGGPLVA